MDRLYIYIIILLLLIAVVVFYAKQNRYETFISDNSMRTIINNILKQREGNNRLKYTINILNFTLETDTVSRRSLNDKQQIINEIYNTVDLRGLYDHIKKYGPDFTINRRVYRINNFNDIMWPDDDEPTQSADEVTTKSTTQSAKNSRYTYNIPTNTIEVVREENITGDYTVLPAYNFINFYIPIVAPSNVSIVDLRVKFTNKKIRFNHIEKFITGILFYDSDILENSDDPNVIFNDFIEIQDNIQFQGYDFHVNQVMTSQQYLEPDIKNSFSTYFFDNAEDNHLYLLRLSIKSSVQTELYNALMDTLNQVFNEYYNRNPDKTIYDYKFRLRLKSMNIDDIETYISPISFTNYIRFDMPSTTQSVTTTTTTTTTTTSAPKRSDFKPAEEITPERGGRKLECEGYIRTADNHDDCEHRLYEKHNRSTVFFENMVSDITSMCMENNYSQEKTRNEFVYRCQNEIRPQTTKAVALSGDFFVFKSTNDLYVSISIIRNRAVGLSSNIGINNLITIEEVKSIVYGVPLVTIKNSHHGLYLHVITVSGHDYLVSSSTKSTIFELENINDKYVLRIADVNDNRGIGKYIGKNTSNNLFLTNEEGKELFIIEQKTYEPPTTKGVSTTTKGVSTTTNGVSTTTKGVSTTTQPSLLPKIIFIKDIENINISGIYVLDITNNKWIKTNAQNKVYHLTFSSSKVHIFISTSQGLPLKQFLTRINDGVIPLHGIIEDYKQQWFIYFFKDDETFLESGIETTIIEQTEKVTTTLVPQKQVAQDKYIECKLNQCEKCFYKNQCLDIGVYECDSLGGNYCSVAKTQAEAPLRSGQFSSVDSDTMATVTFGLDKPMIESKKPLMDKVKQFPDVKSNLFRDMYSVPKMSPLYPISVPNIPKTEIPMKLSKDKAIDKKKDMKPKKSLVTPCPVLTTLAPIKKIDTFDKIVPKDKCIDLDTLVSKDLIIEFNRKYSNLLKKHSTCKEYVVFILRKKFKVETNKYLPIDISKLTKRDVYHLLEIMDEVIQCPKTINIVSGKY